MKYGRTAFELDRRPVSFGSVVALGMVSGHLGEDLQALRDRLAAEAYLERHERGLTSDEITPALNAWRSARGQTSAELTRRWLEEHELELSDLVAHISRTLAFERIGEELQAARVEDPAPLGQSVAMLLDHLLFVGRLPDVLDDAMVRAAVEGPVDEALLFRQRRTLEASLAEVGGAEGVAQAFGLTSEEAAEVLNTQARFLVVDGELCSPEALAAELSRARRGLVRIEYAEAVFAEEGVAREVIATLRDDRQMWLEQLAHHLEVEPSRRERTVDDLGTTALGTRLATGAVGDVVGPERQQDGLHVYEVLGRHEPSLKDGAVRGVLQKKLRRKALSAAVERRIRCLYV
jgi:hypothetical protein